MWIDEYLNNCTSIKRSANGTCEAEALKTLIITNCGHMVLFKTLADFIVIEKVSLRYVGFFSLWISYIHIYYIYSYICIYIYIYMYYYIVFA